MRLVIDTNIIVGELVHRASIGRQILRHPDCEIMIAEEIWTEADEKIALHYRGRKEKGLLDPEEEDIEEKATRELLGFYIRAMPLQAYSHCEAVARARMQRDPDDWPTLALAMAVSAGIWTRDKNHFWGCGVAGWRTEVILHALEQGTPR